jgi:hypothetical protein
MLMGNSGSSSGSPWFNVWLMVGVVILAIFGIGIIVGGIILTRDGQPQEEVQPTPTMTSLPSILPTAGSVPTAVSPLPTATPLPEATEVPATDIPPTETVSPAMIEAGASGVNVRSGPGTTFSTLGRLEPGEKAVATGKYADWWQIDYGGASGWVAGWVVTATGTDSVAEVVPPASPIPPTAAPKPTDPPATPPPAPAECRGIVVDGFQVEGAPGPYGAGSPIWFNLWITNKTSSRIEYRSLGVDALRDGTSVHYQQSYSYSDLDGFEKFDHRDRIILQSPGTYDLWLTIGFTESEWCRLMGPVRVVVQ